MLVIGAGPAGIVSGYYLQQAGIAYEIVDRATVIASTWANLYPSLRLNTTRYFSHMPGQKFPKRYGLFPSGRQYHEYVESFVKRNKLNISLGVEITRVAPEDGGWRVESNRGVSWHPVVIVATGRFNNPYRADIPGLDTFTGTLIHAQEYHEASPFKDKRVMVIGSGPSGVDIAIDIGEQNAPERPALLSMRTGIVLRRRYPLGASKHGWVLATRWLPDRVKTPFLNYVEKMGFPASATRGIKAPQPDAVSGAVAVRGPELVHAVRRGHVICVEGPERINPTSVTLSDGTTHEVDAIVLSTGYRPCLSCLDESIRIVPDSQGWPGRYNSRDYQIDYAKLEYRGSYDSGAEIDAQFKPRLREVDGHPGLFQVGLYYKGKGTMYNINVEAEIAAAQIAQYLGQA